MNKTKEIITMTFATLLISIGVYFFKFPNNFSMGGVSGLAVILAALQNYMSSATIMTIINMLFLLLGFIFLNKEFGFKTIYCTLVLSFATQLMEYFMPLAKPLTDQIMLELVFAVMLPGIGSAILFTIGASSGGTDILAMIIRKHTNFDIGKSLLMSDFIICLAALFVFGVQVGLYSLLGLILKSFIVDIIIENISTKKICIIITTHKDEVSNFITGKLERGVTEWESVGCYTGEIRYTMLTAVSRYQAVLIRDFVRSVDSKSFIVIQNSTEVIGKGFYRGY